MLNLVPKGPEGNWELLCQPEKHCLQTRLVLMLSGRGSRRARPILAPKLLLVEEQKSQNSEFEAARPKASESSLSFLSSLAIVFM